MQLPASYKGRAFLKESLAKNFLRSCASPLCSWEVLMESGLWTYKRRNFMASGQTANFGLNQWTMEDKVLREEFNQNNQKIDTAMSCLGNCHIEVGTYTGNGSTNSNRLTFSRRPVLVLVSGEETYTGIFSGSVGSGITPPISDGNSNNYSWSSNTLTWSNGNGLTSIQLNFSGKKYYYVAIFSNEKESP